MRSGKDGFGGVANLGRVVPRRGLLAAGTAMAGAAALSALAPPAWAVPALPGLRWAKIVFVHTNERFNDFFFKDGKYQKAAIDKFSWVCRDFRAEKSEPLHPWLLDILFLLHWRYMKDEIQILSGYRTPETNGKLEGAALNSQHTRAMALDIHIPGTDNDLVARDVASFVYGGVGMYPGRDFVHFDFGPIRRWVG